MLKGSRNPPSARRRVAMSVLLGLIAVGCTGTSAADQGSIPAEQVTPSSATTGNGTALAEPTPTAGAALRPQIDLAVSDAEFSGLPVSLAVEMSELPEMGFVSAVRGGPAEVAGSVVQFTAVEPVAFGQLLDLQFSNGSIQDLVGGGIVLHEGKAQELAVDVGDKLPVVWPNGDTADVVVVGTFADDGYGSWFVSIDQFERTALGRKRDLFVLASLREGVSEEAARVAIDELLGGYPGASAEWLSDF